MKFYIVPSKKYAWTNKAGREALNVDVGMNVKITAKNNSVEVSLRRAPASAARVMRAVHNMTGMFGIAVDRYVLSQLDIKPGDKVQVNNANIATVQRVSNKPVTKTSGSVFSSGGGRGETLREKLGRLKVGEDLTVSESAAKSGAYSIAKDIGIKITRSGKTLIRRIS
jgi:bifunctional DNA-binding transcriptional regulator/antitoxin component of YhaV-PrlF toxin-antitoxin module